MSFPLDGLAPRVTVVQVCQPKPLRHPRRSTSAAPTSWRPSRRRCSRITAANWSSASAPAATCFPPASLTIKLAKEFGFCYGVERAIDLAYAARKVFPDQPIFLLGEIIHNPEVNDQIRAMGIKFLSGKEKNADIDDLRQGRHRHHPAFGTEVATRAKLEAKGCQFVDTTCGDVMSVWKRVRQYSKDTVTSIIHGKAWHEETKATSSQATASGSGHYLVVFTLAETDYVCDYIRRRRRQGGVPGEVQGRLLGRVSIPTSTCRPSAWPTRPPCCAARPRRCSAASAAPWCSKYGESQIDQHFRFFDTICGATQDRQDALEKLLQRARWICCWSSAATIHPTPRTWRRWARPSCRPTSSRTPPRWSRPS